MLRALLLLEPQPQALQPEQAQPPPAQVLLHCPPQPWPPPLLSPLR